MRHLILIFTNFHNMKRSDGLSLRGVGMFFFIIVEYVLFNYLPNLKLKSLYFCSILILSITRYFTRFFFNFERVLLAVKGCTCALRGVLATSTLKPLNSPPLLIFEIFHFCRGPKLPVLHGNKLLEVPVPKITKKSLKINKR